MARLDAEAPDVVVADLACLIWTASTVHRSSVAAASQSPGPESCRRAALDGVARSRIAREALRAGFQIHLAKPIDPAELVRRRSRLSPDASSPGAQTRPRRYRRGSGTRRQVKHAAVLAPAQNLSGPDDVHSQRDRLRGRSIRRSVSALSPSSPVLVSREQPVGAVRLRRLAASTRQPTIRDLWPLTRPAVSAGIGTTPTLRPAAGQPVAGGQLRRRRTELRAISVANLKPSTLAARCPCSRHHLAHLAPHRRRSRRDLARSRSGGGGARPCILMNSEPVNQHHRATESMMAFCYRWCVCGDPGRPIEVVAVAGRASRPAPPRMACKESMVTCADPAKRARPCLWRSDAGRYRPRPSMGSAEAWRRRGSCLLG